MEFNRIGIKIFAEDSDKLALEELIPVFHRWIKDKSLDDMLIDVADYSHVYAGPGTMLVAYEGNYAYEESGNRRGLVYYAKTELSGNMIERLKTVCTKALKACLLIEADDEINGRISFNAGEIQVIANDRLHAPNNEQTFAAFEPVLQEFFTQLFNDTNYQYERGTDPRERFTVNVKTTDKVTIKQLLNRLPD
ncbi:MAG: hypothetical protein O7C75_20195 [Verrucomicrobia bacterium]|nr:hypothetical protein [Verrucomicrobiota bacterium]